MQADNESLPYKVEKIDISKNTQKEPYVPALPIPKPTTDLSIAGSLRSTRTAVSPH
jgi:hypothetical protein